MGSIISINYLCLQILSHFLLQIGKSRQALEHDGSEEPLEILRRFELLNVGLFS